LSNNEERDAAAGMVLLPLGFSGMKDFDLITFDCQIGPGGNDSKNLILVKVKVIIDSRTVALLKALQNESTHCFCC